MDLKPAPACGVMMRTLCFADDAALSGELARTLAASLAGPFTSPTGIMLAGGSTPLAAYARLAGMKPAVDPNIRILFSDDRHVPPDHPQSNFKHIAPLLLQAGLAETQILRIRGELPLEDSVRDFAAQLSAFFAAGGVIPLGLLGLGADGHTASLFSNEDLKRAEGRLAVGVQRPDGLQGVSATPGVLARVQRLLFVVAGAGKKAMAEQLVRKPTALTAGLAVRGHRGTELWTDRAAWPMGR